MRCSTYLFLLVCLLCGTSLSAQLNYQGVARNANGVALAQQNIGLRLTIRDGSSTGNAVYSETRDVRTNQFGLFNVVIGGPGAKSSTGLFQAVNWSTGNKFLQVEIDPNGGAAYLNAGTSQLQSVPFSFFANAAFPIGVAGGDLSGSSYPNPQLAPKSVNSTKIADTAISNNHLKDGSVKNQKLETPFINFNSIPVPLGRGVNFVFDSTGGNFSIIQSDTLTRFVIPAATRTNRGFLKAADFDSFAAKIGPADTAALLSTTIRTKDTAAILGTTVRIKDTAQLLSTTIRTKDTAAILGTTLRIKDTAQLLATTVRIRDTAILLSTTLRVRDTAQTGMLRNYIKKSDSAQFLSAYLPKADSVRFTNRLALADTAQMLTAYLRKADTSQMLLPYFRQADTVRFNNRWSQNGNIGTSSGVHFLGTTDTAGLRFRVNNVSSGFLQPSGNNVAWGYNTPGPLAGSGNTAVGAAALLTNSSGNNNTALGNGADVGSNGLTNATALGSGAKVLASNTIQLGDANVTNVNTAGSLTSGANVLTKKIIGTSNTPSLTVNPTLTAAGITPTIVGNDMAGYITLTLGGSLVGGNTNLIEINFSQAYPNNPPIVIIQAVSVTSGQETGFYVLPTAVTSSKFVLGYSGLVIPNNRTIQISYQVLGR